MLGSPPFAPYPPLDRQRQSRDSNSHDVGITVALGRASARAAKDSPTLAFTAAIRRMDDETSSSVGIHHKRELSAETNGTPGDIPLASLSGRSAGGTHVSSRASHASPLALADTYSQSDGGPKVVTVHPPFTLHLDEVSNCPFHISQYEASGSDISVAFATMRTVEAARLATNRESMADVGIAVSNCDDCETDDKKKQHGNRTELKPAMLALDTDAISFGDTMMSVRNRRASGDSDISAAHFQTSEGDPRSGKLLPVHHSGKDGGKSQPHSVISRELYSLETFRDFLSPGLLEKVKFCVGERDTSSGLSSASLSRGNFSTGVTALSFVSLGRQATSMQQQQLRDRRSNLGVQILCPMVDIEALNVSPWTQHVPYDRSRQYWCSTRRHMLRGGRTKAELSSQTMTSTKDYIAATHSVSALIVTEEKVARQGLLLAERSEAATFYQCFVQKLRFLCFNVPLVSLCRVYEQDCRIDLENLERQERAQKVKLYRTSFFRVWAEKSHAGTKERYDAAFDA